MTNENTCIWIGASGKQYKYWWYTLPHSFKEGVFGNYIYAKIVDKNGCRFTSAKVIWARALAPIIIKRTASSERAQLTSTPIPNLTNRHAKPKKRICWQIIRKPTRQPAAT